MNWLVRKTKLEGVVKIPSSKSLTLRAIIIASLCDGKSIVESYLKSDDTSATINSLRDAGIVIETHENHLVIYGNTFKKTDKVFNVGSSATALRFLIPIFLVKLKEFKITGNDDLLKRPMDSFFNFFDKYKIDYLLDEDILTIKGDLKAGLYEIDGTVSSQYTSGLYLALATFEEPSNIVINNQLVSKPYLDMTIKMAQFFGISNFNKTGNLIKIGPNNKYISTSYQVEGDYSQAANYLVLGVLGYKIKIEGLSLNSLQGDYAVIDFINILGGKCHWEGKYLQCVPGNLIGAIIDLVDNPDLFPILSVLAVFTSGTTEFINIENLKYKESNRINSITTAFDTIGIEYQMGKDWIKIYGKTPKPNKILNGFNDHRVIMALTILAIASQQTFVIINTEGITKTYPNFFEDIRRLGGNIEMKTIDEIRKDIINIDKQMIDLFKKRSENVMLISQSKKQLDLPIIDKDYEKVQLKTHLDLLADKNIEGYYKDFYAKILDISYSLQEGAPKMGLLGKGLTHSYSSKLHHIIGRLNDYKYDYFLIEIKDEEELKEALNKIRNHEFKAFNVTMPYKQLVIKHLDLITNNVYSSGSVNLVYLKDGKLIGDNVDYDGIVYSLSKININLKNQDIYILGTGGTAQTIAAVFDFQKIKYTYVSRNKHDKSDLNPVIDYDDLKERDNYVIINATPVGMFPNVDNMPINFELVRKANYVFDVIYNPTPTKLVQNASRGLNGLDMFVVQGIQSFNIVFNRNMIISKKTVEAIKEGLNE